MDINTAESLTRLQGRAYPDAKHDFLRCQLGHTESKKVQTSAFRSIVVPVYHLIACGRTWDEAVEMVERKKKS